MCAYYIFLIFVIGVVLTLIFEGLIYEGFENTIHGIELVLIIFGLIAFLNNIYDYYVLLILVIVSFRKVIRVICDCIRIKKNNCK